MQALRDFFGLIEFLTWGWALIPLLVIFGVFITVLTGFVQFQFFRRMFRVLSGANQTGDPNAISAREALLISVGGRVGGGNIAGVAVAITLGGPGAVFWMWAIALVGMATSLVECSLAQLYKRREPNGDFRGGPARSIIHGLGAEFHWLAVVYAVCLIAAFALGFNAFQGNTVAGAVQEAAAAGEHRHQDRRRRGRKGPARRSRLRGVHPGPRLRRHGGQGGEPVLIQGEAR